MNLVDKIDFEMILEEKNWMETDQVFRFINTTNVYKTWFCSCL